LPTGVSIECWPMTTTTNQSLSQYNYFNTFVLNMNKMHEERICGKVYGTSFNFYEKFEAKHLDDELAQKINYSRGTTKNDLYCNKSIVLLSRYPLFDTFKNFLDFIYKKFTNSIQKNLNSEVVIPIEKYLNYLMNGVPFPTYAKPNVLVHLSEEESDCLSICLPEECILPHSYVYI
jgi:hypothetical protein